MYLSCSLPQQVKCHPGRGGIGVQPGAGSLGIGVGWPPPHMEHNHASPSLQVCEPLPSLPEVRSHAQVSLSLLSPAHRRLREPQPYPVCPPLARHHRYTPGNLARLQWPELSQRGSTAELQRHVDMGLQSPLGNARSSSLLSPVPGGRDREAAQPPHQAAAGHPVRWSPLPPALR